MSWQGCHRCGRGHVLIPDDDGKMSCAGCFSKYRSQDMYEQKMREKNLKNLLEIPWYKKLLDWIRQIIPLIIF